VRGGLRHGFRAVAVFRDISSMEDTVGGVPAGQKPWIADLPRQLVVFHMPEVSPHKLVRHFLAQELALNYRVVVMESGVDSGVLDFTHQLIGAGEGVSRVGNQAVHGEGDVCGLKIPCENGRDGSGDAAALSLRGSSTGWPPLRPPVPTIVPPRRPALPNSHVGDGDRSFRPFLMSAFRGTHPSTIKRRAHPNVIQNGTIRATDENSVSAIENWLTPSIREMAILQQ
jgi:hypothetical protein